MASWPKRRELFWGVAVACVLIVVTGFVRYVGTGDFRPNWFWVASGAIVVSVSPALPRAMDAARRDSPQAAIVLHTGVIAVIGRSRVPESCA